MRKIVKRALGVGVLGGVAYAAWRAWSTRARRDRAASSGDRAVPVPAGAAHRPVATRSRDASTDAHAVGRAERRRRVPDDHPVKAKLASGIFHVPGGANYDRTNADRCYVDAAAAAEADGLRARRRSERDRVAQPRSMARARLHAGAGASPARRPRPAPACRSRCTISAASPLGLWPTSMSRC